MIEEFRGDRTASRLRAGKTLRSVRISQGKSKNYGIRYGIERLRREISMLDQDDGQNSGTLRFRHLIFLYLLRLSYPFQVYLSSAWNRLRFSTHTFFSVILVSKSSQNQTTVSMRYRHGAALRSWGPSCI